MEITKKTGVETLIRCIVLGQSKGVFTIKDAAVLYRIVLFLRGGEDDLDEKKSISLLVGAVTLANSKGCYTLEEVSLIDKVINFLEEENQETNKKVVEI
jgi:hypothetical protein